MKVLAEFVKKEYQAEMTLLSNYGASNTKIEETGKIPANCCTNCPTSAELSQATCHERGMVGQERCRGPGALRPVYDRVSPALGQAAFDCLCLAPDPDVHGFDRDSDCPDRNFKPAQCRTAGARRSTARSWLGLLAMPSLMLIAILVAVPVLWMLVLSFVQNGEPSLAHYQRMITYSSYSNILLTTFRISTIVTLICVLVGYPVAFLIAQLARSPRNGPDLFDHHPILDLRAGAYLCVANSALPTTAR